MTAAPRSAGPRLPLVALALVLLLSGCAGPPSSKGSPLSGDIDSRIVGSGDEGAGASTSGDGGVADAAAGNGELRGTVVNDVQIGLEGAVVSLLGTPLSATTGPGGAFGFTNVTPGTLRLRVVADLYRVHEGDTVVKADRVTEVTVTLVPLDGRGPGYRPHLHDYWGDRTEITLIDHEYDLRRSSQYDRYGLAGEVLVGGYEPNNGNWWWPLAIPERDDSLPPIVLPGTAQLRITLDWGSDVTVQKFIVGYFTAQTNVETKLDQQGKGEARTLTLAEGDADNGHQGFSLWRFNLRPVASATSPQTAMGAVRVQVVMVKADAVPAEPGHEDFWNGTTSLVVMDGATVRRSLSSYWGGCGDEGQNMVLDQGRLFPPGTNRMTVKFGWAAKDGDAPGMAAGTGTMRLKWKAADLRPDTPIAQFTVGQPKATTANSAEYDVVVEPGQTDAFYQKKSNWVFHAERTDLPDTCMHNNEAHQQWTLEVVVHKDPAFV